MAAVNVGLGEWLAWRRGREVGCVFVWRGGGRDEMDAMEKDVGVDVLSLRICFCQVARVWRIAQASYNVMIESVA